MGREQHRADDLPKSNSFSPHLTKAAVGCALSHRAAWERLAASSSDWALIVEDDVHSLAPNFCAQLRRVLRDLPPSWKFCYLGYHESSGDLLRASDPPRLVEVPADATITGLFGYLLRRSAARALLEEGKVFPLRNQVDVAMKSHDWRGGRYGTTPSARCSRRRGRRTARATPTCRPSARPTSSPTRR